MKNQNTQTTTTNAKSSTLSSNVQQLEKQLRLDQSSNSSMSMMTNWRCHTSPEHYEHSLNQLSILEPALKQSAYRMHDLIINELLYVCRVKLGTDKSPSEIAGSISIGRAVAIFKSRLTGRGNTKLRK